MLTAEELLLENGYDGVKIFEECDDSIWGSLVIKYGIIKRGQFMG